MKTLIAVLALLPAAAMAQDAQLSSFARSVLAQIQQNSFDANREYCGLIGVDPAGNLVATRARKGRRDSCQPRDFEDFSVEPVASYHTHGRYADPGGEVPSPDDVLADAEEGIDGFVATPGGRLWFVDGDRLRVTQVCPTACLPADPRYDPDEVGRVARSYSLDGLEDWLDY